MSKPRIKDIRRAYVLDILLRFAPLIEGAYPEGFPQKEIMIKIIEEQYRITNIDKKVTGKKEIVIHRDKGVDTERKLTTALSKTVNSLEQDGIITITPLRVPGKRGAHQNVIKINKTPEALYKILKGYDEAILGGGLEGARSSFVFKHNLLTSEYYKSLVNMDLINELISLSDHPFNDKDKELIYYLILSSPGALKRLFFEVYDRRIYLKSYVNKYGKEAAKEFIQSGMGEFFKSHFINSLQVDFIKEVKEYHNIPNFNIEININVKFKDEDGKKVYEFSNDIMGLGDYDPVKYPFFDFI